MNTTAKQKKERLGTLRDEVKEFHPLLNDLLKKVPRVKRVEYTHGQFEQGADFVLFREDDALGDTEYAGVIVKTGKIVSDISKIREQIRECSLHRYAVNGKRNINLDEVWVVTNEHISKAAQQKIYEEFKSTKIKFVQNSDVVNWIDSYLPSFWGIKNAPIARYLDSVVAGVKKDTEASSLIPKTQLSDRMSLGFRPIETEYKSKKKKERSTPLVVAVTLIGFSLML